MAIHFHELTAVNLPEKQRLKKFIKARLEANNKKVGDINFIFCTDDYLLTINRESLNHDFFTDIITFDLSGSTNKVDADIFISIQRVADNAMEHKQTFKEEIHRVIFHGILHLLGYKDKSKQDILKMREQENLYLAEYL